MYIGGTMSKSTSSSKRTNRPSKSVGAKTSKRNLHVVPRTEGWVVRSEGSSRATSVHASQRDAIDAARKIARKEAAEVVIHGKSGRIRERDSYGYDPFPPRPRKILYPTSKPNTSREAIRRAVSEAIEETTKGAA